MKKLFHLGALAFIVISISSCSKSTNELVQPNSNLTIEKNFLTSHSKRSLTSHPSSIWGISSFYPAINQPVSIPLGDPANSIIYDDGSGQNAVFYVLVDDPAGALPNAGILQLTDETTGVTTPLYKMLSNDFVGYYPVTPPVELDGKFYLFGIVPLSDINSFNGHKVTLYAEQYVGGATYATQLSDAFTYIIP